MQAGAGTMLAGKKVGACQGVTSHGHLGRLIASQYGLGALFRRRLHVTCRMMRTRNALSFASRPQQSRVPSHTRPHVGTGASKGSIGDKMKWQLLVLLMGQNCQLQALENLKDVTRFLVRIVVRQCEVHTGERIRRSLQLYTVYSRMWGEEAARRMLSNLRKMFLSKGRNLLLSAVCITQYNWDKEKISDEALQRAVNDLDSVGELCKATVECENCGKRQVIDQQMAHVEYCTCDGTIGYIGKNRNYDSWEPFIERDHHIVWRQRHHVHNHLFAYKVYGTYDDVSLRAFMEAQLNSSFRMEWDDSALDLRVLDSQAESNSDLLYWLVKFPQFFANRDYVFKRRVSYNKERREAVIVSQAIDSDDFPEEKGIYRVNEYWSRMVIRASSDTDKPGIEYTLTYFDNPGTSLPQSITNFVAASAFPNFLCKVHQAALSLQSVHEKGGDAYVSLPDELRYLEKRKEKIIIKSIEEEALVPGTREIQQGIDVADSSSVTIDIVKYNEVEEESTLNRVDRIEDTEDSLTIMKDKEDTKEEELCECNMDRELAVVTEAQIKNDSENIEVDRQVDSEKNSKHSSLSQDMSLHLGKKRVVVDVLEAMEVVAPDMDQKTKLSQKVEELTASTLQSIENKFVLLEKLEKIKSKLKTFQEHAFQKKRTSMEKLEEFENHGHYDHSGTDEKTLRHLENLFQAVNRVLQADKDMRTGKGYLNISTEHESDAQESEEVRKVKVKKGTKRDASESRSENSSEEDQNKKSKPPDDPPTPPGTGSAADVSDAFPDQPTSKERTENEIEAYNDTISNIEKGNISWWLSWPYFPFNTKWSEDKAQNPTEDVEYEVISTKGTGNNVHNETKSSFSAQAWYIIGLGWIFQTESPSAKTDNDLALYDASQEKTESGSTVNGKCDKGTEETKSWYWYPVDGVYRIYTWVFNASQKENV